MRNPVRGGLQEARTTLPVRVRWPLASRRRRFALVAVGMTLLVMAGALFYVYTVEQRYHAARASADRVQERYTNDPAASLRPEDLPQLTSDLRQLEDDLEELQSLVDVPLLSSLARRAPVVGADVAASQQLLDLGVELTTIAHEVSQIANEVRLTFEATGMTTSTDARGPTWLDVVREQRPHIDRLAARFDAALVARQQIDPDHLPQRGQQLLPQIDELLARAADIREEYVTLLPLMDVAFGANADAYYMILLQNREEIRPAGGFPGTFASVVLSNGRLLSYQSDNMRTLDLAYIAQRETPIRSPGPIHDVLQQKEFLPHDALWSPDFGEAARTFVSMYDTAGWPGLTGVIGVNDSVVQQVLAITGPYQVEINGQPQTVSAENYLQLIESYRDPNWWDPAAHKRVVAILGAALIDHVKATDFATKKQIYFALRDAADRRELQIYLIDPTLQAEVSKRGWDGALLPDPATPTLAMTVGGLTGGKKALTIGAQSLLEITPVAGGTRVRWTITLNHRGDPAGDPVYQGYEYAWLSAYLPEGATLLRTSRTPAPAELADDPRAVSFGIALMPGTNETTTIEFRLPTTERLLLRRQAGFADVEVRVTGATANCALDWSFSLTRDHYVDLTACQAVPAR
jgi:hypothetical protein